MDEIRDDLQLEMGGLPVVDAGAAEAAYAAMDDDAEDRPEAYGETERAADALLLGYLDNREEPDTWFLEEAGLGLGSKDERGRVHDCLMPVDVLMHLLERFVEFQAATGDARQWIVDRIDRRTAEDLGRHAWLERHSAGVGGD